MHLLCYEKKIIKISVLNLHAKTVYMRVPDFLLSFETYHIFVVQTKILLLFRRKPKIATLLQRQNYICGASKIRCFKGLKLNEKYLLRYCNRFLLNIVFLLLFLQSTIFPGFPIFSGHPKNTLKKGFSNLVTRQAFMVLLALFV